jgi:hypothetical protein
MEATMNNETVVLVYSLTGKAYAYAQELAQSEACPCIRITTKHKSNFIGYMHLGYSAVLKKPIHYQNIDFDFTNIKQIILVSPIHAGRVCAPVRSFLFKNRSFLKQVDLILTHSSEDEAYLQAAEMIEKELIFKFNSVKSITLK